MRGKLIGTPADDSKSRITPADAGKTHQPVNPVFNVEDHPRGCGENFSKLARTDSAHGSPPRMRGKQLRPVSVGGVQGITPADAGKTATKTF